MLEKHVCLDIRDLSTIARSIRTTLLLTFIEPCIIASPVPGHHEIFELLVIRCYNILISRSPTKKTSQTHTALP